MARETLFRLVYGVWGLKDSVVLIGTFVSWDFTGLSMQLHFKLDASRFCVGKKFQHNTLFTFRSYHFIGSC